MDNLNSSPTTPDSDLDFLIKDKSRAQTRHNNVTKALRKKNICEKFYGWQYYHNLHQYSKNKIHCSCPLCRAKTNAKKDYHGGSKHRQGGKNYTMQDRKRIEDMIQQEQEAGV